MGASIREARLIDSKACALDNDCVLVVMPAHNAAKTICAAIMSVLWQSHLDWRLIVVDDASSDATYEIANGFTQRDPRIECIRNTGRRGVACARNLALRSRRSERWIAFLDSDDLWHADKLRVQLAALRQQSAALCFASYWRVSEEGLLASRPVRIPPEMNLKQFLGNTAIATSTVVFDASRRTDFLMKDGISHEDFDLWTRLLDGRDDFQRWTRLRSSGETAIGIQQPLMAYRICTGSVSRKRVRMSRWVWRILRNELRLPLPYALRKFAEYALRASVKHFLYRPRYAAQEILPSDLLALVRYSSRDGDSIFNSASLDAKLASVGDSSIYGAR